MTMTITSAAHSRKQGSKAASVSRSLAEQGLRPLPSGTSRMREGIRVRRGHESVTVVVDLDSKGERTLLAGDVLAALRTAGFHVLDRSDEETSMFLVTHPRIAP